MNEYVWLIGGSLMSIPMAKEIKARGYGLLLTDINEQCACREYADDFYRISVFDEEKSLDLARVWRQSKAIDPKPFQRKIAAVLCIGCDAGPPVSLVSDYLRLPSAGYEVAKRAKNKGLVRHHLDLDHPDYCKIDVKDILRRENDAFLSGIRYPMVVKPVGESGSKGFHVAGNFAQLREAVKAINGEVIIEELLIGQDVIPEWREQYGFDTSEIALDFFVQDGKVYYANGALRLFWDDLPGIEAGHINPYVPSPEIIEKAQYAAKKLGITWGPFKCDFKQDKRYGWVVMECATRLSGGFDHPYTCIEATGKDITGAMLDIALGKRFMPEMVEAKYHSFVCAYAPRFKPGKIDGWDTQLVVKYQYPGYQVLVKGIDGHDIYQENEEIKPLGSNHDRPLFIIRRGQTMDEALQAAMDCAGRIKPNYAG